MFEIDRLILVAAALILLGIVSSKLSSRVGLPVLVLFLGLGMAAGSEGPGRIPFENYPVAHAIGTLALVVILFDGGMRTKAAALRLAWAPGTVLATAGVLVTAVVTGVVAARLLEVSLLGGLLLGSIVGSTDAAAVFSIFRSKALSLRERVSATLEVESGANDPMAVFLTVGLLEILLGEQDWAAGLWWAFLAQMSIGAIVGIATGRGAALLTNSIALEAAGLYPLLAAASGLLAYGVAASIGGSGFLSVYLAGIVLGNTRVVFQRGVLLFHDGLASLAQLVMFVVLGLLVFPSRLASVAPQGLLLAGVLIFVARPLAVFATLWPFRFSWRELLFISWVGLKGAVPIILAIYPLLFGLPGAHLLFNMVFFVVLISAVTQGWTLPWLARVLDLQEERPPEAPLSLEITSLHDVDGDIVQYTVSPASRASGKLVRDLALPDGVVVSLIARHQQVVPPRGGTRIEPGDFVFVVLQPAVRGLVDRVFSSAPVVEEMPLQIEFPLRGRTTLAELEQFYGIRVEGTPESTLSSLLQERLGEDLEIGANILVGGITLIVREILAGRVELVGLALPASPQEPGAD